ncbi:MAG: HAD family phosphatase [Bryobacteraceae bacterium]|jgi:HAD superfamily hydrolase (TIGR01509 family)
MSEFDAILFDFDGVLADTEPLHFACWAQVLAPVGVTLDWEFYRDRCIGVDDREILRMLAARCDPPRDWEVLWERYGAKKELFRARVAASPPFAPALGGFLAELRGAYKLAVVSSTGRTEIESALTAGGLLGRFDALVCGREAGGTKPAPDPYLLAARLLASHRPLVVEDSEVGIVSARTAGFETLAVASAAAMPEQVRRRLAALIHP